MSKYKRVARLRRTLTPAPEPATPGGLKRSLWGLTERHASHLLAQQERALGLLESDTEAAHRSLVLEIDRLRKRVEMLRQTTDILTQRLVNTRATSGAASRMVEQQLAKLGRDHAGATHELKFEAVRASAELQLERQAFRDFLAELYRVLAGRSALPPDLEPAAPALPPAEMPHRPDWQPLLAGKIVGRTVKTTGGRVIAVAGDRVSAETITAAEESGLLPDLFLAVRVP